VRTIVAMLVLTHSPGFAPTFAPDAATASQRARRPAQFGKGRIALLFAVLLAIASVPILLNPLPPISDYINHLARMHVIAAGNSDPFLHRYYEINWQVIPNLMMDMIVPLFERVMNVYLAGQTYTLLSFALIISGTLALHRSLFSRWSALPLIAFPLLYNDMFLVGTMNFVFGIGLMLWALAAWVALRERSRALRLAVSALFVLGLFFCHLFVLGDYAVGLLAFESHRLCVTYVRIRRASGPVAARRALPGLMLDYVLTGVPFLPVLALLMMSPTRGLWDYVWSLHGKGDGALAAIRAYSDVLAYVFAGIVAAAAALALRYRALSFHGFGWVLFPIGVLTYLALPQVIFETYLADQRMPISLAFMLVACFDVDFRSRFVRWGFATALVLILTARVAEVEYTWAPLSAGVESFRQSVELLNRGAKVAVAYADPNGGDSLRDYGLVHADCIAVIERSALVTTEFTVVGKQILHARPAWRSRVDTEDGTPPTISELVRVADHPISYFEYWRRWTTDYDYLYVLFTTPNFQNPDPERLTELYAGDRFILYRIERAQVTAASKPTK
jgi:hypothetical protein